MIYNRAPKLNSTVQFLLISVLMMLVTPISNNISGLFTHWCSSGLAPVWYWNARPAQEAGWICHFGYYYDSVREANMN